MATKNGLTVTENNRLSACETDIERGGRLVVEAFAAIHDEKLYRQYGTFAEYCLSRWGITPRQGYRRVQHGQVLKNLEEHGLYLGVDPENVTRASHSHERGESVTRASHSVSARAAEEVADLPAAKQVEIVKKAAENGNKPTAKAVKAARETVAPKPKGNAVSDYFDGKNGEPEKKPKVHRADADMPPMQLDETGAEVPKLLIGVFERRESFRKASRMVLDAAGIVKVLKGETAGRYLTDEADCLEHLASEIEASMPHSVDGRTWRCARG